MNRLLLQGTDRCLFPGSEIFAGSLNRPRIFLGGPVSLVWTVVLLIILSGILLGGLTIVAVAPAVPAQGPLPACIRLALIPVLALALLLVLPLALWSVLLLALPLALWSVLSLALGLVPSCSLLVAPAATATPGAPTAAVFFSAGVVTRGLGTFATTLGGTTRRTARTTPATALAFAQVVGLVVFVVHPVIPAAALGTRSFPSDQNLGGPASDESHETRLGLLDYLDFHFVPASPHLEQCFGNGSFHRLALYFNFVTHAVALPPLVGAV